MRSKPRLYTIVLASELSGFNTRSSDGYPGLVLVSILDPFRFAAEHIFEGINLCLFCTQDMFLFNPSGRVASRTYSVLSASNHIDSWNNYRVSQTRRSRLWGPMCHCRDTHADLITASAR